MKSFTACSRCGQPIMDDWHDCPYCKAYCKIKDVKPIAEAKLNRKILSTVITFAIFATSTALFFATVLGKSQSNGIKSNQHNGLKTNDSSLTVDYSSMSDEELLKPKFGDVEKLPIFVEYGDGQYETLEWCYNFVKNHPESTTS